MVDQNRLETLGPAEKVIQTVVNFGDHLWHGRPGVVRPNGGGVPVWTYISKQNRTAAEAGQLGEVRKPGMFPEAVRDIYRKALDVYNTDAELAARWASFEFSRDHNDLKTVLAALMLVQNRAGQPVMEDGQVAFLEDDYREVGEAMLLYYSKGSKHMMDPKHLLRVHEVLMDPVVAQMNNEAGFGRSARRPSLGRYLKTLERWLRYRERNTNLLEGLAKAGWRTTVQRMARLCGYKPDSQKFFEILRWKQSQAQGGHRKIGLDLEFKTDSWADLSEAEICQRIVDLHLTYQAATARLPAQMGLTRAIVAAIIEGGGMSNKDMIIFTPTLEELGLLKDREIRNRWDAARQEADDQRARNIARNVRDQRLKDKLDDTADDAVRKEVAAALPDLDVLFLIDISGSMQQVIDYAKRTLAQFVQAFPPDQLHVAVFNTAGRKVTFKSHTRAGVENELSKFHAAGGTDYSSGIAALRDSGVRIADGRDCLLFTVGDQDPDSGGEGMAARLQTAMETSGYNPIGFCHLHVGRRGNVVERTAALMGKPFVEMNPAQFEDVYQLQRTLRNALLAAPRMNTRGPSLLQQIMETELLRRPY